MSLLGCWGVLHCLAYALSWLLWYTCYRNWEWLKRCQISARKMTTKLQQNDNKIQQNTATTKKLNRALLEKLLRLYIFNLACKLFQPSFFSFYHCMHCTLCRIQALNNVLGEWYPSHCTYIGFWIKLLSFGTIKLIQSDHSSVYNIWLYDHRLRVRSLTVL